MAEKDIAEELEERLDGGTPDEPAEEPDLEDEPEGDPDQPDDEPPGPDEPDEPELVETRTKRTARDRVQDALRERDEARRVAAEAQRERDEARAQRERDTARAEEQREQEILAGLDERGKTDYLMAKELKRTQEGQTRLEREIADSRDQAVFAAKAAKDQRRARLMDEVERVYNLNRAPGLTRDAVYYLLLGKKLEDGTLGEGAAKQRKAAAGRVAAQRTAPRGARSDAAPRARRGGDLAARMEADDPVI